MYFMKLLLFYSCNFRTTSCIYHRIGCPWRGPYHEVRSHHETCSHPNKSGAEVIEILRVFDQENEKEKKLYNNIFDLLSYENITFNGNNLIMNQHNAYYVSIRQNVHICAVYWKICN